MIGSDTACLYTSRWAATLPACPPTSAVTAVGRSVGSAAVAAQHTVARQAGRVLVPVQETAGPTIRRGDVEAWTDVFGIVDDG
jgi:hypothetical protein